MNKKTPLFALVFSLAFICIALPVQGWGPNTHMYINEEVLKDSRLANSPIANTIRANRQCFDSGFMATDISVIYYYTEGEKYEATHSWRFQKAMMAEATNDCERAFDYGIAAHLIQDSIAHNTFVPDKIRETLVPNYIIHPVEEGKIEAWIINQYPNIFEKGRHSLDWFLGNPAMIRKMQNQIYSSEGIILDVEQDARFFADALGNPAGFYTRVFKLPDVYKDFSEGNILNGALLLLIAIGIVMASVFKLRRSSWLALRILGYILIIIAIPILLFGVLLISGGITAWVQIADAQRYMDTTIERTVYIFQPQNWEKRVYWDSTGFDSLEKADAEIGIWFYAGIALVVFVIAFVGWLYVRKRT